MCQQRIIRRLKFRRIADDWGTAENVSELSVVGEPVLIQDAFDLIERDGDRLALWTIVLLSSVLLITLMDLRFILIAAFDDRLVNRGHKIGDGLDGGRTFADCLHFDGDRDRHRRRVGSSSWRALSTDAVPR